MSGKRDIRCRARDEGDMDCEMGGEFTVLGITSPSS